MELTDLVDAEKLRDLQMRAATGEEEADVVAAESATLDLVMTPVGTTRTINTAMRSRGTLAGGGIVKGSP